VTCCLQGGGAGGSVRYVVGCICSLTATTTSCQWHDKRALTDNCSSRIKCLFLSALYCMPKISQIYCWGILIWATLYVLCIRITTDFLLPLLHCTAH